MTAESEPRTGVVEWCALTVPNPDLLRDLYESVVGWKSEDVAMNEYDDYAMSSPATGKTVAGICHDRGPNAKLPPQWLIYIVVEDVDASAGKCVELGGEVVDGPRDMGGGRFCVIRDPAGAVCALFRGPEFTDS